jgi:hypothetical protein
VPRRLMRSLLVAALALVASRGAALAQSSQFSSRGLGLPTRPFSAHSLGMGGALAMFDFESSLNPASIAGLRTLHSLGTATSNWRNSDTPAGSGFGRDTRFGQIQAAGPLHINEVGEVRVNASVSLSSYLDRNYGLASQDSITLRGERLGILDSLTSQGGMSDLRLAVSWSPGAAWIVGVGAHLLTGSARVYSVRVIESELYDPIRDVREVSYLSYGFSGGVTFLMSPRVALAGIARVDAPTRIDRDTEKVGEVSLPVTLGVGARVALHPRFVASGHFLHRGWGNADAGIKDLGGLGAQNSRELAAGIEWAINRRDVSKWPVRLGLHQATLPFMLEQDGQGKETGISAGTGLRLGAGGRGGLDLSLEHIWRSEGSQLRERAFQVTLGISIRQ